MKKAEKSEIRELKEKEEFLTKLVSNKERSNMFCDKITKTRDVI